MWYWRLYSCNKNGMIYGMGIMALTPSTFILEVGSQAPAFSLPEPKTGNLVSLSDVAGEKGTLVVFGCNHCPYVVHLAKEMGELADEVLELGISTVAISSNDVDNYPQDAPDKMVEFAEESGWNFPYLYDESQEIAIAYSAACTPDFFLLNAKGELYYAGQFDESRPGSGSATGDDLRDAAKLLAAGEKYTETMKPATGCNIKWKAGNTPKYFG